MSQAIHHVLDIVILNVGIKFIIELNVCHCNTFLRTSPVLYACVTASGAEGVFNCQCMNELGHLEIHGGELIKLLLGKDTIASVAVC